ncbi:MAG: NAD(P)H-dependent oxidoreductase [Verrucomicrobiota bacterium]
MTPISSQQLLDTLNWRYATKKFDPTRKIPAQTWSVLEQSLVLTPSSFGLQPWQFLVVDNPELRAQLVGASWGQTQVVDASHLVVFLVRKDLGADHVGRYMQRTAALRGVPVESLDPFMKVINQSLDSARRDGRLDTWQTHQIYIALGQFMTAAALLGVDTCPMEGLVPAKYDEILGLTGTGWATVCACPAGYRAADDKYAATAKVRFDAGEVIRHV